MNKAKEMLLKAIVIDKKIAPEILGKKIRMDIVEN